LLFALYWFVIVIVFIRFLSSFYLHRLIFVFVLSRLVFRSVLRYTFVLRRVFSAFF
jgi:hypothetical protein